MDGAKYIIVDYLICDFCPIIFPSYISHDSMVRKLNLLPEQIDSAGFVNLTEDGRIQCHGRSSSLKKEPKAERDARLIMRAFGNSTM